MEFKDVIAARHSVRRFTDKAVPREILDDMIAEALLAPSSHNSRSSRFLIVEDRETLEAMAKMRDYGAALLSGAAAAIVVFGDTTKTDLWIENASISATYLMLSATSRGIGNCWVHVNGRPRFKAEPEKGSATEYLLDLLSGREVFPAAPGGAGLPQVISAQVSGGSPLAATPGGRAELLPLCVIALGYKD